MQSMPTMDDTRWYQRIAPTIRGLRAPKDSGEYKSARMVLERTFGPSLAAFAVCAIVLLMLLTFVATQAIEPDTEIEVQIVEAETVELDFQEELEEPEPIDPIEHIDSPIAPPDIAPSFEIDPEVLGMGPTTDNAPVIPNAPLITQSAVILRDLYGNRSPEGRAGARNQYGGKPGSERAVINALRWLKNNQDEDGSWRRADTTEPIAMAGLATLTFLAHGVTPEHAEFGETLRKALQYLVSVQRPDGLFPGGSGYTHGISAYAISEAYAMTRIMSLRDPMVRSIRIIIDGQQSGGGFDYNFRKAERWDTSVSGWMVQAKKAAQMTGVEIEGLDESMRLSIRFMRESAWNPNRNMFSYGPGGGGTWVMTGIGVLSMQLLGQLRDASVRNGLASLATYDMSWNPEGGNPVYGWYYVTQAFFHQGGALWKRWNEMFADQLVEAQHDDGHWSGTQRGGPVYATTFNALMLQVYYRYLPTFRAPEERPLDIDVRSDDDVIIEVL